MKHLTKTQVISDIATATGETKTAVGQVLDALFHFITLMEDGDTTTLTGFGTFRKTLYPAKLGRNPRTGETIEIAAQSRLTFKASKAKAKD